MSLLTPDSLAACVALMATVLTSLGLLFRGTLRWVSLIPATALLMLLLLVAGGVPERVSQTVSGTSYAQLTTNGEMK